MKTYKHKTNGSTMTYKDGCMKIENLVIEGTPNLDYWEEVVEKDYEILSFKQTIGNLYSKLGSKDKFYLVPDKPYTEEKLLNQSDTVIYSVKRLYDGEIFTIGDKVNETITGKCTGWTISEFSLKDNRCFSAGVNINNIERVKEPILITYDGVKLFNGDKYWFIWLKKAAHGQETFKIYDAVARPLDSDTTWSEDARHFSSFSAAEKYLKDSKPQFSLNDIKEAKKKLGCLGDTLIEYLETKIC